MILRTFRIGPIVLTAMLCAMAGCSKRSVQSFYAVSGKLTYEGQPMAGAQITFRLVDDPNPHALGIPAHADANGEYKVTA